MTALLWFAGGVLIVILMSGIAESWVERLLDTWDHFRGRRE